MMSLRSLVCQFVVGTLTLATVERSAAQSYDPKLAEAVLVPISVGNVPGAYGSIWSTELWYRNNSPYPVAVIFLASSDAVPTIGRTERLRIFTMPPQAPGQFLLLTKPGSDSVQFDLRLFNRADPTDEFGTKLPVVRTNRFATGLDLINVAISTSVRSALRIYALPTDGPATEKVTIRVYSYGESLLGQTELTLTGAPAYGEIQSLQQVFPMLSGNERVRVHIESHGREVWAFITMVSNATQRVTVVTPE